MKKLSHYLSLSLIAVAIFTFASCNTKCDCETQQSNNETEAVSSLVNRGQQDQNKIFREQLVKSVQEELKQLETVKSFQFTQDMLPEGVTLNDITLLSDVSEAASAEALQQANAEAAELVYSIFNSLLAAENKASQLQVEFTMSDEPVENGMFIFSIGSETEQDLTFEMYDEEGFALQAQNTMKINAGNNYKALNVSNMESGSYLFRLKNDKEGKELVRKVQIEGK